MAAFGRAHDEYLERINHLPVMDATIEGLTYHLSDRRQLIEALGPKEDGTTCQGRLGACLLGHILALRGACLVNLLDVVDRKIPPEPWEEGEKIPWNDPDFSGRMLREHLSQEHDAASRRFSIIGLQVNWIHSELLQGRPGSILDLGCGPGLYVNRLARLGHRCVGVDFGPASVAYAAEEADRLGLQSQFIEGDVRSTEFGSGYELVMMLYGEFNIFTCADAELILRKAYSALADGGILLLEAHTLDAVRSLGAAGTSWYTAREGLFSDRPHVCMTESFWDEYQSVAIERFFIVDAKRGVVSRHILNTKGYTQDDYVALLAETGFRTVDRFESLGGQETRHECLEVWVARKAGPAK